MRVGARPVVPKLQLGRLSSGPSSSPSLPASASKYAVANQPKRGPAKSKRKKSSRRTSGSSGSSSSGSSRRQAKPRRHGNVVEPTPLPPRFPPGPNAQRAHELQGVGAPAGGASTRGGGGSGGGGGASSGGYSIQFDAPSIGASRPSLPVPRRVLPQTQARHVRFADQTAGSDAPAGGQASRDPYASVPGSRRRPSPGPPSTAAAPSLHGKAPPRAPPPRGRQARSSGKAPTAGGSARQRRRDSIHFFQ